MSAAAATFLDQNPTVNIAQSQAPKSSGFCQILREDLESMDGHEAIVWLRLNQLAAFGAFDKNWSGKLYRLTIGQLLTCRRELVKLTKLTDKIVRRCLAALEAKFLISSRRVGGDGNRASGTLITVLRKAKGKAKAAPAVNLAPQGFQAEPECEGPKERPVIKEDRKEEQPQSPPPKSPTRVDPTTGVEDPWAAMVEGAEKQFLAQPLPAPQQIRLEATEDEALIMDFAEEQLQVESTDAQRQSFLRQYRADPRLRQPGKIEDDIRFLARHSQETLSINRVFHVPLLRQKLKRIQRQGGGY